MDKWNIREKEKERKERKIATDYIYVSYTTFSLVLQTLHINAQTQWKILDFFRILLNKPIVQGCYINLFFFLFLNDYSNLYTTRLVFGFSRLYLLYFLKL